MRDLKLFKKKLKSEELFEKWDLEKKKFKSKRKK